MLPRPFGPVLKQEARHLFLAVGFLTRLVPAMAASRHEMARACLYYPFAGVILGVILVLPFALRPPLVLFDGFSLAQAFAYVLLSAFFTRALHFDGLADVLDAVGSGKTGPDFQTVLKDSRLGAFGALGIVLAVCGQIALAAACLQQHLLAPLFFAPVLGRCLPVLLATAVPPYPGGGLGTLLQDAPRGPCLLCALAVSTLGGFACLGSSALPACILSLFCLWFLARLARREGGYNGDFCGFLIIAGECAALGAPLL